MNDCVFCKVAKGEIPHFKIWEDKNYVAFLDIGQINPGHTLLIPKKHSEYLFDMEDAEYSEFLLKAKEIAKLLKLKIDPKRVGLVVEGFGVSHVHIHLVPINKAGELNMEKATHPSKEELEKVVKIILE